MKKRHLWIIRAGLVVAILWIAGTVQQASSAKLPAGWFQDWDQAAAEAKKTGKPMLAVFSAEWCGPCKMMERDVYPKEHVKAALEKWVPVHIDEAADPKTTQKFNIDAFPTFVLLDSDAKEFERFKGARPAEGFVTTFESLLEAAERFEAVNRELETSPESPDVWKELGDIYLLKNDMQSAITSYEKAAYYDPKDATGVADDLYFLRALPTTTEDLATSSAKLEVFEEKFPESDMLDKALLYNAWISADLKKYDRAISYLASGIEKYPASKYSTQMRQTMAEIIEMKKSATDEESTQ